MQQRFLNFRGYTKPDPLDGISQTKRCWFAILVTGIVSAAFLFLVFYVLNIATLRSQWLFLVECVILAAFAVPVVFLRKSGSLVLIGLVMAAFMPLDIYLQAQYRDAGLPALWDYNDQSIIGFLPPLLKIFVVWLVDGLVVGPFALWCSRTIAKLVWGDSPGASALFSDAYRKLFPKEWLEKGAEKPKRDFSFYALWILGTAYFAYFLIVLIGGLGASPWPEQLAEMLRQSYENPALTINTFIKIALMGMLAYAAAYNPRLRWHCALALLAAHGASAFVSLGFYFYDAPGTEYRDFLLISAIVDTILSGLFAYIMLKFREEGRLFKRDKEFPVFYSLPHRFTTYFFIAFGSILSIIVFGVLALRLLCDGESGWGAVYGFPDPQVANTVTKYTTLALLAFMVARREALREYLSGIISTAYTISVITSALWLMFGGMLSTVEIATRSSGTTTIDWYFMLNVVLDGLVLLTIYALRRMFYHVEYSISGLSPSSARQVIALHRAFFPKASAETNAAILKAVDAHVAGVQGRRRGLLHFPFQLVGNSLNLLYGFRPPLPVMSRAEQQYFLRKYILRPPSDRARSFLPIVAEVAYRLGTAVHALVHLAHYASIHGWKDSHFVPADARDRLQGENAAAGPPYKEKAKPPTGPEHPANFRPAPDPQKQPNTAPRLVTPTEAPDIPEEVNYLIIGSGAGGAVMAYRLAKAVDDPEKILVVERGPRYSPIQDFNEHEMEMVRRLYKEGGLQQTRRFDLTVLQGECVGGTTVINNGICVKMPKSMEKIWADDYQLNIDKIDKEYAQIAKEIDISTLPNDVINKEVADRFRNGVAGYNNARQPGQQLILGTLEANHRNIMGGDSWNLGNKQMRKRSMLETYIPWAEANGVKFISETSAVRMHYDSSGKKANAVTLRTRIGHHQRVNVRKGIIIAGGAIASSHFLMRSDLKKNAANVGRGVSCNFALPIAVSFGKLGKGKEIKAFDGIQIALAAMEKQNRAIFETYFNPPGSFAISLPLYFEQHAEWMKNYQNLINFGALVGAEPRGIIKQTPDIADGRVLSWEIGKADQKNIKFALATLVELAVESGGKQAAIPMEPGLVIPLTAKNVTRFRNALKDFPLKMQHLRLVTAHPQGGNRMIGKGGKGADQRVVDEDFRVDGLENVFVADASIFPSGITVNPQWTIMAMSSLAAKSVLKNCR